MEDPNSDLQKRLLNHPMAKKLKVIDERQQVAQKEEVLKRMQTRYQKYFKQWRDYDMLTTILAMIGLVLAIVEV